MASVEVVAYNPSWPLFFEQEATRLLQTSCPLTFYHIGSTSIPGLKAKPIIDILGVVPSLELADAQTASFEKAGYIAYGEYGLPRRRFFKKEEDAMRPYSVHLHIYEEGNPHIARHILFCDYLRAHPNAAKEYEALKELLAARYPLARSSYTHGKSNLIKEIDRKALAAWNKPLPHSTPPKPLPNNASDRAIIKAHFGNSHLRAAYLPRYIPNWEIQEMKEATCAYYEGLGPSFNFLLNLHLDKETATDTVKQLVQSYTDKNLSFYLWINPLTIPAHLDNILKTVGLTLHKRYLAMHLSIPTLQPSSRLEVRRILDRHGLETFASILTPPEESALLFDKFFQHIPQALYTGNAPFEYWIGYQDEKAVACALLVFYAGVVGIYSLTTLPAERKKGYGKALLEHLLQRAKNRSYSVATLFAEKDRHALYQALGFKEHGHCDQYFRSYN